ncbi:phosphoglucosamine mutase [Halopiger djelfimassiliensis]|uniref:phosphoglucosamine mutase n=1 Tax=Halopiger djelfimassiliensis TaxID=1293047 RepID=UPI000677B414|nr:phosphoglucosamine mutase [Halopiger djelfimassiliensis]
MFGTSGIRGPVGEEITATLALSVGRALASEGNRRVVVGRDVRESGTFLHEALAAGVQECGADVVDVGVAATPTVARAVSTLEADAGVVITASHNPPTDNGVKLWTPSGKAFGPDRREAISRRLREDDYDLAAWDELGSRRSCETTAADAHVRSLRESVSVSRTDAPNVVVDLGNGAAGSTARVLHDLGCTVRTLNGQEDGSFPGRPSEPTRETLTDLMCMVAETDADLGIAHDGDGDRMLAVDGTGAFVPKDALLALFAVDAAGSGDRVAAPVDTSLAVDDALADVGASLTRTRVGDVYVAERTAESDVVFGGEPSGAWIWPDQTLCPDGPLAACKLVELVSRDGPLSELVSDIETYPIERDSIEVTEKSAVMERVRERVERRYDVAEPGIEIDTRDGVRVSLTDGWFLVRKSGTQPLVRVTAEARDEAVARELFHNARELVRNATADH